jgi:hypothetical protein
MTLAGTGRVHHVETAENVSEGRMESYSCTWQCNDLQLGLQFQSAQKTRLRAETFASDAHGYLCSSDSSQQLM